MTYDHERLGRAIERLAAAAGDHVWTVGGGFQERGEPPHAVIVHRQEDEPEDEPVAFAASDDLIAAIEAVTLQLETDGEEGKAIDPRPPACRFRLQDEGKAYPRSSCTACGRTITTGLGYRCYLEREEKP